MSVSSKKVFRPASSGRFLSAGKAAKRAAATIGGSAKTRKPEDDASVIVGKTGGSIIARGVSAAMKRIEGTAKAAPAKSALAERARRAAEAITDEQDAAITAGAMADPDSPPNRFIGRRRGRPKAASPKELVTMRLDPDVLAFFRADGDGWQTRINEALRKAAGLE